jgi:hypothetical protein
MRRALLATLLVLALARPSDAQFAALVYDAANHLTSQFQLAQLVLQVANQVLELTGMDAIVIDGGLQADVGQISALAQDAEGLMHDISALQAQIPTLFDTNNLPRTPVAITQRYDAMQDAVRRARLYAVRTQTLVSTTVSAADHLTALVSGIAGFLGNQQANQTMAQVQATTAKLQAATQLQAASHQRMDVLERMSEDILRSSMLEMRAHFLDGWPGVPDGGGWR